MPAGECGSGCDLGPHPRIADQPAVAEGGGVRVEGIAEIRGMDARIADLTEVRATMSGSGCEPPPAMMPAAMRVPETVTTEMTAARVATAVTTTMATSVPTAMTATAMTAAALPQSRACQHAGKRHHGNSNDRSQHRILPQGRAIEASETDGIGTSAAAESSRPRRSRPLTPPARSCRG
jgi:hypothetical protein